MDDIRCFFALKHPNIVVCYGANITKISVGKVYLVTELLELGTLADIVYSPKLPLDPDVRVRMLLDVALALRYMHEQQLVHRDLRLSNLFVNEILTVKVGVPDI